MTTQEIIIKPTHRGLRYIDGVLSGVLEAGRYVIPRQRQSILPFLRRPQIEIVLIDIRERDLTIKGQEILTADKVAVRVSIIVQFQVSDPIAALQAVEDYESRLYGDVQLAARRSLASMTLEQILTNRTRLSEDILRDVQDAAARYGVAIQRADVKDLIFPGNLQEIMNKVLAAERLSEAQLVEARTKAEAQQIDAHAKASAKQIEAEAEARRLTTAAEAEAEARRLATAAEIAALRERALSAEAYTQHPALMRLQELETLAALGQADSARIYVTLDGATRRED